jgi:hypothetical protein
MMDNVRKPSNSLKRGDIKNMFKIVRKSQDQLSEITLETFKYVCNTDEEEESVGLKRGA